MVQPELDCAMSWLLLCQRALCTDPVWLLLTVALAFTSGSCSPAGKSPEFPYQTHFQPQVL